MIEGHGFAVREAKGMVLMDQTASARGGSTTKEVDGPGPALRRHRELLPPLLQGPEGLTPRRVLRSRRVAPCGPCRRTAIRHARHGSHAILAIAIPGGPIPMNGPLKRLISFFESPAGRAGAADKRRWVEGAETSPSNSTAGPASTSSSTRARTTRSSAASIEGYRPNESLTDMLPLFTRPGDCVLDLGTHVGTFSLTAAAWAAG